ncbi:MAG: PAS domain S-box protein, partial [Bacteroidetes bacterium]|nr:PAS domain S-box protein [Bacteroidota bacterium]
MAQLKSITQQNEAGFRALFENATIAIVIVNRGREIEIINPFAEKLFGYEKYELKGKLLEVLVPENLRASHIQNHADYYENPVTRIMAHDKDVFARKKDGSIFPVEVNLCSYDWDNDMRVVAFVTDITERRKAQEEQLFAEKRIQLLIEHTPAAVAMLDLNMNYIIVSNRWMKDYHLGPQNIIGMNHYDVFPHVPERWRTLQQQCLSGETICTDEGSFIMPGGKTEWLKWELCPWYAVDHQIGGIIIFSEVITHQKMAKDALEKLNQELEEKVKERTKELIVSLEREKELNEIKSRFVSTASHEFRTPLSVILSSIYFVESYNKADQEEKRKKHIGRIKDSVKNLTDILNDFLSIEKLEQGKLESVNETFDLHELANDIVDEMGSMLKRGQKITLSYHGEKNMVQDKKILRNIFLNLLSNAVKYSGDDKEIIFDIDSGNSHVAIKIIDNGIGIPEADQKNIFSKFYRAANVSGIQGTGLGLN